MPVISTGVTVGTAITEVAGPDIAAKLVYLHSGTDWAVRAGSPGQACSFGPDS